MSVKAPSRCQWAKQVGLLVAGALSAEEATQVEQHLAGCPACQRQRAELTKFSRRLTELVPADVSPRLGFEARWQGAVSEARSPRWQRFAARLRCNQNGAPISNRLSTLDTRKAACKPALPAIEESSRVVKVLTDGSANRPSAGLWRFIREQRRAWAPIVSVWLIVAVLRLTEPSAPAPVAMVPGASWRELAAMFDALRRGASPVTLISAQMRDSDSAPPVRAPGVPRSGLPSPQAREGSAEIALG